MRSARSQFGSRSIATSRRHGEVLRGIGSVAAYQGAVAMGDLIQSEGNSEILQDLYNSGIDVSIACMAGAGFLVELGMDGAMIDASHVR